MGYKSSIEWCDATWNPVRGCSMAKGSEAGGCLNCYAARLSARNLPEMKSPTTGEPFARILESGPRWTGKVELIEKALTLPFEWKKPRRIFVNSLSDLFHEGLKDEEIDRVFAGMALCPQHTFQVLTKRPERMVKYLSMPDQRYRLSVIASSLGRDFYRDKDASKWHYHVWQDPAMKWPLPNVWLGVSVENQATADMRIPLLLQTPSAKRFVSYEPALAGVEFERGRGWLTGQSHDNAPYKGKRIDWLICGGESGPGSRPFDVQWARDTIAQCKAAEIACFVKQLGARPFVRNRSDYPDWPGKPTFSIMSMSEPQIYPRQLVKLKDRKGGSMQEWPADIRVRQFPDA